MNLLDSCKFFFSFNIYKHEGRGVGTVVNDHNKYIKHSPFLKHNKEL